ncbi:MAG: M24 family metallopeptidase [Oscillospiraceae bacterium]
MNTEKIQAKLKENGLDAIVLFSDVNIRYACGFHITDGAVLITTDRAWLFTDSRYIEAARNEAVGVEVELFTGERSLAQCLADGLAACGCKAVGAEERSLAYGTWQVWEEKLGVKFRPAQDILSGLRAVKEQSEVDSIVAAQRIAEKALDEVLGIIHPGMKERDLAAELTYRMMLHGGEGNSFDPICVTGAKTSMPHGVPGDEVIQAGDFVTMDFGCLKNGYCSDMTRTVAVGHVTDEMRRVYDTVYEAQMAGIAIAKAGVPGADIHNAAAKVIADAGYGPYFGHGFGHSLGLEIHEAPNAAPANKAPMPAGAVISAEPGIYIPGRFGVRIEDMLYLTEDGNINLTKAPHELIIV